MNILTEKCINWIKNYFETTGGKKAVIGISGGKDSTVAAALCVKALGADNVIGILMPNKVQLDIKDSYSVCKFLGIEAKEINIHDIYEVSLDNLYENNLNFSEQTKINLAPRIRTTLLYAIAQGYEGGRVCNTSNLCEKMIGWGTLWADTIGDFSPLGNLLVSEIRMIGHDLSIPSDLIDKAPADGLTGHSDEDNFGFTYDELEDVINGKVLNVEEKILKIYKMNKDSQFKRDMIHIPTFPGLRLEK